MGKDGEGHGIKGLVSWFKGKGDQLIKGATPGDVTAKYEFGRKVGSGGYARSSFGARSPGHACAVCILPDLNRVLSRGCILVVIQPTSFGNHVDVHWIWAMRVFILGAERLRVLNISDDARYADTFIVFDKKTKQKFACKSIDKKKVASPSSSPCAL